MTTTGNCIKPIIAKQDLARGDSGSYIAAILRQIECCDTLMPDTSERFPAVPDLVGCLGRLLMQVPAGRVTTCGDLGDALGNRIAAKWVGHFALHHEHDAACPCHRIVRAGGELGAYIAGPSSARIERLGVTKKLLCGSVDIEGMTPGESRPVVYEDRPIGIALRPTAGSRRPIFVSPGHRVDLPFCEQVVRQLLTGRRLPEPLYWADRLGKKKEPPAKGRP